MFPFKVSRYAVDRYLTIFSWNEYRVHRTDYTSHESEKVNQEIESIKMFLADTEINFSEYNEIVVRKLIECIRVMPDGTLVIVLKGGMTIEEQIAA